MADFYVENFGCRSARADGEAISAQLARSGYSLETPESAEVVVVNTCSVTAEADRAARAFIRRTHRRNPAAKIVVTGCYAQRAPEELAAMAGVVAVVGNSHKALAPEVIGEFLRPPAESQLVQIAPLAAQIYSDDRFAHSFLEEEQVRPGEQTRPNLKIQEGCGNRCSFCVIPETRGPSRSLAEETVFRQVEGFVAAGGKELVLSGINLGRWGRDLQPGTTLAALLRRLLQETAVPWLRLSSIEPMDWEEQLIGLLAEFGGKRLARHVHLPLQSGSDGVLRRMFRRYRPWHYRAKVEALCQAAGSGLTLGADVMVGFPGETEAEFEETMSFVRDLPFGYLHLFPYSSRPGTPAAARSSEFVPPRIVEERMARLRQLGTEKMLAHRRSFVGQRLPALTLHTPAAMAGRGRSSAMTENYLPVEVAGSLAANHMCRVRVTGITAEGELEAVVEA